MKDESLNRSKRIMAEQERHVQGLTDIEIIAEIQKRVNPILTHKVKASTMRVPVDYEHDDDVYVGMRLRVLKRRATDRVEKGQASDAD